MIELTEQQVQALGKAAAPPLRVLNPQTQETFVLVRLEDYERLTADDYDDSPWTPEEMEALAWQAGAMLGWEEMTEYDEEET